MYARLTGIDCAACPHVLQTLSGALKTCSCALKTCVLSCTGRTASIFFMLEAHGPQRDVGYVAAPEYTPTER
jgi:hypothetical protein